MREASTNTIHVAPPDGTQGGVDSKRVISPSRPHVASVDNATLPSHSRTRTTAAMIAHAKPSAIFAQWSRVTGDSLKCNSNPFT